MIPISFALLTFCIFLSICALILSAVALIKVMASEKSTHTIYKEQAGMQEAPEPEMTPIPKEVKDMLANPFSEDEFTEETPTKDLQKLLLGGI